MLLLYFLFNCHWHNCAVLCLVASSVSTVSRANKNMKPALIKRRQRQGQGHLHFRKGKYEKAGAWTCILNYKSIIQVQEDLPGWGFDVILFFQDYIVNSLNLIILFAGNTMTVDLLHAVVIKAANFHWCWQLDCSLSSLNHEKEGSVFRVFPFVFTRVHEKAK